MTESGLLVRVPAAALPLRAQALLDPQTPRPADARFQVRRSHLVWVPAVWLAALLFVGHASTRATIAAWWDPAAVNARMIYGGMAAACLFFAVFSVYRLALGLNELRDVREDRYRIGLHVLAAEGLLVAGRDEHTWVPRHLLPTSRLAAPIGGGGGAKSYMFVLDDGRGRIHRLDCGVLTESALSLWARDGQLPVGSDWR